MFMVSLVMKYILHHEINNSCITEDLWTPKTHTHTHTHTHNSDHAVSGRSVLQASCIRKADSGVREFPVSSLHACSHIKTVSRLKQDLIIHNIVCAQIKYNIRANQKCRFLSTGSWKCLRACLTYMHIQYVCSLCACVWSDQFGTFYCRICLIQEVKKNRPLISTVNTNKSIRVMTGEERRRRRAHREKERKLGVQEAEGWSGWERKRWITRRKDAKEEVYHSTGSH